MIIVHTPGGPAGIEIDADVWVNNSDGDLDCFKGDTSTNAVATFFRGQWLYVHDKDAITFPTIKPADPLPFRAHA